MIPPTPIIRGALLAPAILLLSLTAPVTDSGAQDYGGEGPNRFVDFDAPWDDELIAKFALLPVQDNGRIKPFDTVARYSLLRFQGRQSIKFTTDPDGEPTKRSATEWALYAIFAPDSIKDLPLFIVDDSEAAVIAGLEPGSKRDRYSYNEIIAQIDTLRAKAGEFSQIPAKQRGRLQKMVIELYNNMNEFEYITKFFEFAQNGVPFGGRGKDAPALPKGLIPDARGRVSLSNFIETIPEFRNLDQAEATAILDQALGVFERYSGLTRADLKVRMGVSGADEERRKAHEVATKAAAEGRWKAVQEALRITGGSASLLTIFPPPTAKTGDDENDWFSPTDLTHLGVLFDDIRPFSVERLKILEALNDSLGDKGAFTENTDRLFELVAEDAGTQLNPGAIEREVKFYQRDYFTNSLVLFILAFTLVIVSFLAPGTKWGRVLSGPVAVTSTIAGLALLVWGIIERCLIMGRPPVGTLYETNLFIAATAVLVGLAIEYFNRRRIALLLAAFIGAGLLFVANRFHLFESKDTMDPLVAVLRTNFWLSVHVTTVCMGYSAGLVAALIGYIYLIARLFGEPEQGDVCKELTRMAYGVICFGMLFSLFGTVTGGIWANYSWGRFWGWDPKENGAFMIVLWNMVILHARLGGYAKQLGIHVLAIILGAIVAFSWWGVNQLEIGLHSYGFTDGIMFWLLVFWAFTVAMLVVAGVIHLMKDSLATRPRASGPEKVSA